MNRADRRARAKATPAYKRGMTRDDKIKAFYKNGITLEDLQRNGQEGYDKGWSEACRYTMKVCYAAAVRAMHQLEGWGKTRNARFLRLMDDIVTNSLTSDEAINAALEEAGVIISFDEVFPEDRIEEVGS